MFFSVRHATRFIYSQPVFCEPMTLRLRPREDCLQRVVHFNLKIDPPPAGVTDCLDLEGNSVSNAWFDTSLPELSLETEFIVETLRANPFDFILPEHAAAVPISGDGQSQLWQHYSESRQDSESVAELARELMRETSGQTIDFLASLTDRLYHQCETIVRETGEPWPPDRTLAEGRGSCRDQAVLFNEVCRCVGIPARFVSGYVPPEPKQGEQHLHAWSEVFLPIAGWRGFDPTNGLAVADQHVALAAGRFPQDAAPTVGTFRGTGALSTLESQLFVSVTDEPSETPTL